MRRRTEDPVPKPTPTASPAPRVKAKREVHPDDAPALDERRLRWDELAPFGPYLDVEQLRELVRDGRPMVRANAAYGLAAAGQPLLVLVGLLRDSEAPVALAAAEAIAHLGARARPILPQITQALDGTRPDVTTAVVAAFAALIESGDDGLIEALDVPSDLASRTVLEACARAPRAGQALLARACAHEHGRIRINAIGGFVRLGVVEHEATNALLARLETTDPVPEVRIAAKKAMIALAAQWEERPTYELDARVPDFEERRLDEEELREHIDAIDVDAMVNALRDGRNHVRINAARALAVLGPRAGRTAAALGLLLRDGTASVRREAARALAALGDHALAAADDLVGALGDLETSVAEAAADTLAGLGEATRDALVRGLEAPDEEHGRRVVELIGRLPDAAELLTAAFRGPAVNVQVNAALGLGLLGRDRVGPGLAALAGARTGGVARTREAVRRAFEMLEARGDTGPRPVPIDGFDDRVMPADELATHRGDLLGAGVGDLTIYLRDGRDAVRANAATALGLLGAPALPSARSIGVLLRDDGARVRLAAARALAALGADAVAETSDDLVGALGDARDDVAGTAAEVLRAHLPLVRDALVRGLETDRAEHGQRIVELIGELDDAADVLCDAFASPAINVQVNAALGLGSLGNARVGRGRAVLEGARTGGWKRTREAVHRALARLDDAQRRTPRRIDVPGFESAILEPAAFAGAALPVEDLVTYLQDGRAAVRANAATALGTLGPEGAAVLNAVRWLAVLLRDDDMRVRVAAAGALDTLGDDAVRQYASFLVGALSGPDEVAEAAAVVLRKRKGRVVSALLKGLETADDDHAQRILQLVVALPDAADVLCEAFESPIENVQVQAALGLGMLGARAGTQAKKMLEGARTRTTHRVRDAVFKALPKMG